MNFTGLTVEELVGALKDVPPHTLKAVELFKANPPTPGQLFPSGLSRDTYIEASKEMIVYQRSCAALAHSIIERSASIAAPTADSEAFAL